jgi:hypothetical protein
MQHNSINHATFLLFLKTTILLLIHYLLFLLHFDIVRSNQTFLSWQGQAIHDAAMKVLKGMDTWDIEAYFAEMRKNGFEVKSTYDSRGVTPSVRSCTTSTAARTCSLARARTIREEGRGPSRPSTTNTSALFSGQMYLDIKEGIPPLIV